MSSPLILGFPEDPDPQHPATFESSFAGGRPMFLESESPLLSSRISCDRCDQSMTFLIQIYAPEESQDYAYHRIVHVFVCNNNSCASPRRVKALRSQSPENAAISQNADNVCSVCGLLGDKACGKCKKARYCGKEHQRYDWNVCGHDKSCGVDVKDTKIDHTMKGLLFPRIDIIEEDEKLVDNQGIAEQVDSSAVVALVPSKPVEHGSLEDLTEEDYENSASDVDAAFLKFQKRIASDPDQILRYARHYDDDVPVPLCVSEKAQENCESSKIPACVICGKRRSFEFQIMPQLLNSFPSDCPLDFGTICIYTCHDNCDLTSQTGYAEEYAITQEFSNHGMGNEFKQGRFG
eukprot:Partr_v1_DN25322_c1_g1_i1_m22037 putative Programmed cell death